MVFVVPGAGPGGDTMGGNFSNRRGARYLGNLIATLILPAAAAGDDPRAPVTLLEWNSPYAASKDGSRVKAPLN